jgi:two-component system chemotaxis sensor kinase CheA
VGDRSDIVVLAEAIQPAASTPICDDAEILGDFLMESREHMASVENNLLELERCPGDAEILNATFRSFHTIKGLAGFLGFGAVQEVAHETETILDLARSGSLLVTPPLIDIVLRASDYLKSALNHIESHCCHDEHAPPSLLQVIARGAQRGAEEEPETAPQEAPAGDREAAPHLIEKATSAAIKVDADKIEYLIDMVGELVIAQSMVRQHPTLDGLGDPVLTRSLSQLSRVTSEVQKTAMSMRMAPISSLFQKMSRVIRDVARKAGKSVSLVVIGDDSEMDRKILEGLAEPLMHMVRNSIDHGIESPEKRALAGKNPDGTIRLRAERESGNIVIEIADDGNGLDIEKIRLKAIERKIITEQTPLGAEDIQRLIFEPGFSTADKVTELSGRGVGLDVVRRQVEALRGRVEIRSEKGQGTTFTVRVPLTLATVDGLLIRVGVERYILPTFAVREIFHTGDRAVSSIANFAEVTEFRKSTIPVIHLVDRLRTHRPSQRGGAVMIVVQCGVKQFCLAADEVIGRQEVVIKNLGGVFRDQPGIAGGAILGDGRVGLILDLDDLLDVRYGASIQ